MNLATKNNIKVHLETVMQRIINKRTVSEPFDLMGEQLKNPFGYRLVPEEIWKGSKFERSFVTSLGQGVFEQLGKMIALGAGAIESSNQYTRTIKLNTWQKEKVDIMLGEQRNSKTKKGQPKPPSPIWEDEVDKVAELNNNSYIEVDVTFDLYIKRKNGQEEFYGLKTVKPNLDQTERAKRDMLFMKTACPSSETYFALPYNPAGDGGVYSKVHPMPSKLFNMDEASCVLIGSDFWNKIGDSPDTYQELLDIFMEVGKEFRRKIQKDYLGI